MSSTAGEVESHVGGAFVCLDGLSPVAGLVFALVCIAAGISLFCAGFIAGMAFPRRQGPTPDAANRGPVLRHKWRTLGRMAASARTRAAQVAPHAAAAPAAALDPLHQEIVQRVRRALSASVPPATLPLPGTLGTTGYDTQEPAFVPSRSHRSQRSGHRSARDRADDDSEEEDRERRRARKHARRRDKDSRTRSRHRGAEDHETGRGARSRSRSRSRGRDKGKGKGKLDAGPDTGRDKSKGASRKGRSRSTGVRDRPLPDRKLSIDPPSSWGRVNLAVLTAAPAKAS